MDTDLSPGPRTMRFMEFSFTRGLWLTWGLAVVSAAVWVLWPALRDAALLDVTRLVISAALAAVGGLLIFTVVEIRLAPWHFPDRRSLRAPHQGGKEERTG